MNFFKAAVDLNFFMHDSIKEEMLVILRTLSMHYSALRQGKERKEQASAFLPSLLHDWSL